jgi:vancomycin resistance protein YoaR
VPSESGLTLDLDATLEGLTGWVISPAGMWEHLLGGRSRPLRTAVDGEGLQRAIEGLAAAVESPAVEGSISLAGGRVTVVQPRAGSSLDVATTAQMVARRWPSAGPVAASLLVAQPAITTAEIERVRAEFADKAMSGPVRIAAGGRSFPVTAAALAPAISFRAHDGRLEPVFDDAKLVAVVRRAAAAAGVERAAKDATVRFAGIRPTVVPAVTGRSLRAEAIPKAVVPALTSEARLAEVPVREVQPAFTTAEAARTLPRGRISTFTTYFPYNPPRTNNITIAARTLNGTYVRPGGQFSLNGVLGERTPEKGYQQAPVINNGRLEKDYGGGVSQVSTTTFNAAFFAGVRFDQYTSHSFYISRYPEGREATVSWPDVDQKWTNTTNGGILIRASVSGSGITVSFYGIKTWDIEAAKGPRRNIVEPRTIVDDSPDCVKQTASEGFDVTVTRTFKKNGAVLRTESFNTHYIPEDDVTCTNPEAA